MHPHKCPCCDGHGIRYSPNRTARARCISCAGSGIVWGVAPGLPLWPVVPALPATPAPAPTPYDPTNPWGTWPLPLLPGVYGVAGDVTPSVTGSTLLLS